MRRNLRADHNFADGERKQTPSRNRVKALLQRLGLPDDRFSAS